MGALVQDNYSGLWHDPDIRYPINYARELVSLDTLIRRELGSALPEYRRRLTNVIIWHQGQMGIGDGWRPTPSNTSEASKRGESLHQDQTYEDGLEWWSAADMVCRSPIGGVHVAPPLNGLPIQGSEAARIFGIHANVGTPGQGGFESWHAQCTEQDGWLSWVRGGRRYPASHYPFPVLNRAPFTPPTPIPPLPPTEDLNMVTIEDIRVYDGRAAAPAKLFAIQTNMKGKKAVMATVTVVSPPAEGYLSVNGTTSFCPYQAGITAAATRNFMVQSDGCILLGSSAAVQVLVDITGYDE